MAQQRIIDYIRRMLARQTECLHANDAGNTREILKTERGKGNRSVSHADRVRGQWIGAIVSRGGTGSCVQGLLFSRVIQVVCRGCTSQRSMANVQGRAEQ